jgi:hypothetical protein
MLGTLNATNTLVQPRDNRIKVHGPTGGNVFHARSEIRSNSTFSIGGIFNICHDAIPANYRPNLKTLS